MRKIWSNEVNNQDFQEDDRTQEGRDGPEQNFEKGKIYSQRLDLLFLDFFFFCFSFMPMCLFLSFLLCFSLLSLFPSLLPHSLSSSLLSFYLLSEVSHGYWLSKFSEQSCSQRSDICSEPLPIKPTCSVAQGLLRTLLSDWLIWWTASEQALVTRMRFSGFSPKSSHKLSHHKAHRAKSHVQVLNTFKILWF